MGSPGEGVDTMREVCVILASLFLLGVPAAGLAQVASGGVNAPEHQGKPYLIVVSFDGLRPDYLGRVEPPNFDRVAAACAVDARLIPVFYPSTIPSQYSFATRMYADRHGLVDNRFYDPVLEAMYAPGERSAVEDGRWYGGEPIWVTAVRQGMVAASYS